MRGAISDSLRLGFGSATEVTPPCYERLLSPRHALGERSAPRDTHEPLASHIPSAHDPDRDGHADHRPSREQQPRHGGRRQRGRLRGLRLCVRDRRPQLHWHAFHRGGQVDRPAAQQLGHEEQRAPGGGAVRQPKAAAVGSVAAVATAFVDDIHVYPRGSVGDAVQSAGQLVFLFAVAWVFGGVYRKRREYLEALHEQTAARVVVTERLRIARELHDSVAHSIGIITVLSGAAARVMETKPEQTRQALTGIETTSRETLLELQRMLGALRRAEPDDAMPRAAPLAPADSLADVPQLAERTADAGVRVHVTWRGEQRPLPPEIELSAFRIIQESVTNVVRHSGARTCRVAVGYEPKGVTIEVVDDGDDGLGGAGATGP